MYFPFVWDASARFEARKSKPNAARFLAFDCIDLLKKLDCPKLNTSSACPQLRIFTDEA
jgi:hypothetical protein